MATIHINPFFDSPELTPETCTKVLVDYAKKLEEAAKAYRTLASTINEKNIKLTAASGYPYGGSISVDDIDAARIKKTGLIVDLDKEESANNQTPFFIDSLLDKELDKLAELGVMPKYLNFAISPTESEDGDIEIELDSEIISDGEEHVYKREDITVQNAAIYLGDIIKKHDGSKIEDPNSGERIIPGTMLLSVTEEGEDQIDFNLSVVDLGSDPENISFDRESMEFSYSCNSCDISHKESLTSIYKSLKTASAILSNLVHLTTSNKELSMSFEFIDQGLRLLQYLVSFDYAIDSNEGTVEDIPEGILPSSDELSDDYEDEDEDEDDEDHRMIDD